MKLLSFVISAFIIISFIVIGFTVPVVAKSYEAVESYQDTESYIASEPYETTETYLVPESYQTTETYIVSEPYQDTETYTESVPLKYEVLGVTTEKGQTLNSMFTYATGSNVYNSYPIVNVSIENKDDVAGNFSVSASYQVQGGYEYSIMGMFGAQTYETSAEANIQPGQTAVVRLEFKEIVLNLGGKKDDTQLELAEPVITPGTKAVDVQRTVTKYRDVEKTRVVTKYQNVETTHPVTQYHDVTNTHPVTLQKTVIKTHVVPLFKAWFNK